VKKKKKKKGGTASRICPVPGEKGETRLSHIWRGEKGKKGKRRVSRRKGDRGGNPRAGGEKEGRPIFPWGSEEGRTARKKGEKKQGRPRQLRTTLKRK